ncbi:hypothetical protein Mapa_000973 [Marchantia paleacea]|nr:hypothetical protein Mapa_000973 [Marchantia paleacea]
MRASDLANRRSAPCGQMVYTQAGTSSPLVALVDSNHKREVNIFWIKLVTSSYCLLISSTLEFVLNRKEGTSL